MAGHLLGETLSTKYSEGQNPQAFKEQPIAEFCGASSRTRDDFIEGMSQWLNEATQSYSNSNLGR